ncbi:MAG: tetratricopeptide repeat protein [Saprospiraceae bacterium]|nr:tetratricopeptide repeat protein [Saprospiraceae bacterium]MDG2419196.1 tetratricopeptide repeat protein [Saprospiraceae bacterium]
MKHYPNQPDKRLKTLVGKYENLSQNPESYILSKAEFILLTDFFEFEKLQDQALEVINYGISKFKNSPELLVRKTRLLIYNYGYGKAITFLKKLSHSYLKPFQVDILKLEILIARNQTDKALSTIPSLKFKYKKTGNILSEVFYLEALAYEKLDHFDKSFLALREVLWVNPNHQDAIGKILMTTELSKKSKEGILLNKFLIKKEHYSAISWFNIAHAYYSEGEYEKAIEAFEFSIIINEDFETAYLDLAEVCMLLGMFQKATQFLKIAFEKFEIDELDRFIQYGESLIKSGEFRTARESLKAGLIIEDSDPDLLFLVGETYRLEKKYVLAIQYYELALEIDYSRDDIHKSLGKIYFILAEFDKAQCHFEIAIENDPYHSGYRTELASFYLNIGEVESCEKILAEAIEELPDIELVYHHAGILFSLGEEERGLELLGSALQENFSLREEVYEFVPELVGNPKVEAIINYYKGEQ